MLWGAFANSSQAMMAMSYAMGSVSQNIANVNTAGYKEKDTQFKTVLSETRAALASSVSSPANGNIFGVGTVDRTFITKSGTITSSTSWSDLAINGRGFFVVSQPTTTGAPSSGESLYTRAGNFSQKAVNGNNYFVTPGGQYLMGWKAGATGAVDKTSLTPVYANLGQKVDGYATNNIQWVANVPNNKAMTGSPQTFTNSTAITDGFGNAQDLTMTWTRVDGDNWQVDFSLPANPASGSVGTITGSPVTVTVDSSGNIVSPTASASGTGWADLTIDWSAGPTLQTTASINLGTDKPAFSSIVETVAVYDQAYNSHNVGFSFEHASNGQWYLRVLPVGAEGKVTGLTSDSGASAYSIPVTFDGAGKIISPTTASVTIDWSGSGGTAGTNTINLDLTKLTQYSGANPNALEVKTIDQNGYASGTMDKVEIDTSGNVVAHFDNGETKTIFQIPVATFTSADQLDSISGTLFRATGLAGDMFIASIADQGTGAQILSSSYETSNVDLEDQFSKMIITQKAYSTNANVFKAADEMTQTARDLMK